MLCRIGRGAGGEEKAKKNYENGGYPGPSLDAFVERVAGSLRQAPNWILADDSSARNYLANIGAR
ncbi:MAG: hypothetical protein BMS9Abin01_1639 [Gammaproteobacteria bacterium]|nr:MAG: hypothetical protein BMS9Abin01_1639 [Gammaproteobacteria bacterium]